MFLFFLNESTVIGKVNYNSLEQSIFIGALNPEMSFVPNCIKDSEKLSKPSQLMTFALWSRDLIVIIYKAYRTTENTLLLVDS